MYRRAFMIATCIVISLGVQSRVAQGHAAGTVGNIHYAHLVCADLLQGVKKDTTDYRGECTIEVQELEILCRNPAGKDVAGEPATQVVLFGEANATASPDEKKKGRAQLEIEVNTDNLLKPAFCANRNWHPIDVIVLRALATINVFDPDNNNTYRIILDCNLQDQFSVRNTPEPYNLTVDDPTKPSAYDCAIISDEHLD